MIERGQDWGAPATVPQSVIVCDGDAAVSNLFRQGVDEPIEVVLAGGDLARTLGAPEVPPQPGTEATRVVCDMGRALVDGRLVWFCAQLVIGGPWWRRDTTVVANAAHSNGYNVAPRAHPGDGRLDVVEAKLNPTQRLLSLRRLPSGEHLPHPDISQRRITSETFELELGTLVSVDGERLGSASNVMVQVAPGALGIYL